MDKKAKRQAALQRQQALVNAAKTAQREMTPEEKSEFDTLQRQIDTLTAEITAEEQQRQQTPPPATTPPLPPLLHRPHQRRRGPAQPGGGAHPHP